MDLTRKQFDILVAMAESKTALTQRELEKLTGNSLGTVNRVFKELTEAGYVADGTITNDGVNALEPYRCKRAVFIAAGFGTRLVPITFNTPKPLVRVHGVRIIDRLIDACLEAGINEIYIVRGYLSELFDQLLYKYPMIKFLENPVYNEANNISSSLVARYMLSNAYVFEADLLISNPKIIRKYHYTSDFLAIKKERSDPKRSYYCNLYMQYDFFERTGEMHFTPPVQTIYATIQALKEYWAEGEEAKWARHTRVFNAINEGLDELGFRQVIKPEWRTGLVSSAIYPDNPNWSFEKVHDYCYERGFTIYPGKISTTNTFRLCALGAIDEADIKDFFVVFKEALSSTGVQMPVHYNA